MPKDQTLIVRQSIWFGSVFAFREKYVAERGVYGMGGQQHHLYLASTKSIWLKLFLFKNLEQLNEIKLLCKIQKNNI